MATPLRSSHSSPPTPAIPQFIALEGVDGAGKSTQLDLLQASLESSGHSVLRVREPGGTEVGEQVRRLLLEPQTPLRAETQLMLFLASRVQLYEECIAPALEQGKIVLSDRYHLSSMIYQGYAGELGVERTRRILEAVLEDRRPQLSVVVKLPLELCLERLSGDPDRFESRDFLEKVWRGFEQLSTSPPSLSLLGDRVVAVDGRGSPAEVAPRVVAAISSTENEVQP